MMEKDGGLGLEITELRLGLPGREGEEKKKKNEKKRLFSEIDAHDHQEDGGDDGGSGGGDYQNSSSEGGGDDRNKVVGWPPVCSYRRKNSMNNNEGSKMYVKVSMDGAPFLRKIDLEKLKAYSELAFALEKLFGCHGIKEALKNGDKSEHVPIYEDKDGDWMLVGDVPWEMFMESCKRLRIMKRSDANGFGVTQKGSLKGYIEGFTNRSDPSNLYI